MTVQPAADTESRLLEVEQINEALRRAIDRNARAGSEGEILDAFLLDAMYVAGADGGAIVARGGEREFVIRSQAEGQAIVQPGGDVKQTLAGEMIAHETNDYMTRMAAGETLGLTVAELEAAYPEVAAYYRARGRHDLRIFPLAASGETLGFLELAFSRGATFTELKHSTVLALAQQAATGLRMVHCTEAAQRCTMAYEREKNAASLASELANTNSLMRAALDELANTRDPAAFVKATLREVARRANACSAHLFTYDASSNRLTQFGVVRGSLFYEGGHPDDPASFREGFDADISPAFRRLLENGGIDWVTIDSLAENTWPEALAWHRRMGHSAYALQVLVAGCRPIGLLGLNFQNCRSLSRGTTDLIQVLAQHMALALGLMRLTEQSREAAILTERARAASRQAQELARMNAALRKATERLTTQRELGTFYGHLVEEAGHLLQADLAYLSVVDETSRTIRKIAYLKNGVLSVPDQAMELPLSQAGPALDRFCRAGGVYYLDFERDHELFLPGAADFHTAAGHKRLAAVPLLLIDRCIGYIGLAFKEDRDLNPEEQELLQTLAQHATLAIHLTQLGEQVRHGAVLEERVALARELHDTLLQGFTGITLQLRALLKGAGRERDAMYAALEAIEAEATRSVREARRAVGDIRGNEPGQADLVTALQDLVQSESTRTHSQLCWRLEGESLELPGPMAESLFRIGREALSNAIRHADASAIEVALRVLERSLRLTVKDDGRGFSAAKVFADEQGHWGLIGMRERAERLGGEFRIESEPGGGTTISVEIPL